MQAKQKKGTTNKGSRITHKTSEPNNHKDQQRTRDQINTQQDLI